MKIISPFIVTTTITPGAPVNTEQLTHQAGYGFLVDKIVFNTRSNIFLPLVDVVNDLYEAPYNGTKTDPRPPSGLYVNNRLYDVQFDSLSYFTVDLSLKTHKLTQNFVPLALLNKRRQRQQTFTYITQVTGTYPNQFDVAEAVQYGYMVWRPPHPIYVPDGATIVPAIGLNETLPDLIGRFNLDLGRTDTLDEMFPNPSVNISYVGRLIEGKPDKWELPYVQWAYSTYLNRSTSPGTPFVATLKNQLNKRTVIDSIGVRALRLRSNAGRDGGTNVLITLPVFEDMDAANTWYDAASYPPANFPDILGADLTSGATIFDSYRLKISKNNLTQMAKYEIPNLVTSTDEMFWHWKDYPLEANEQIIIESPTFIRNDTRYAYTANDYTTVISETRRDYLPQLLVSMISTREENL